MRISKVICFAVGAMLFATTASADETVIVSNILGSFFQTQSSNPVNPVQKNSRRDADRLILHRWARRITQPPESSSTREAKNEMIIPVASCRDGFRD